MILCHIVTNSGAIRHAPALLSAYIPASYPHIETELMNATYLGICALALGIGACAQEKPRATEMAAPSFPTTTAAAPADSSTTASPVTSTSNPASAAPAGAVNPPHGQPGHTCDIPVGAPLSSAPGAATAAPAQAPITIDAPVPGAPTISNTKPAAAAPAAATPAAAGAAAGVRINPPHGQPGHSCDVNVGDPLPGQ